MCLRQPKMSHLRLNIPGHDRSFFLYFLSQVSVVEIQAYFRGGGGGGGGGVTKAHDFPTRYPESGKHHGPNTATGRRRVEDTTRN